MMLPNFFIKIYLYFCICCLYVVCRPSRQLLTYTETSPMPMSGCRVRPMLGAYGHWVVRVLTRVTPTTPWESYFKVISEIPWHPHLLPCVWQWNCHYPTVSVLGLSWPGIDHRTYWKRDKLSNRLHQHRGKIIYSNMESYVQWLFD